MNVATALPERTGVSDSVQSVGDGHRVAVFAVPADVAVLERLLVDQLGLNVIDARIRRHDLPGVLPDPLSQGDADRLASEIRRLGVEAVAVAACDLPDLQHAQVCHHLRCATAGLELVDPDGEVRDVVAWRRIALVSAADVPLDSMHHEPPERPSVIHAGPGHVRPPALGTPPVRGAELLIVCEAPFRALRIDHRAMNYEYLGDSKSGSAAVNFERLLADLAAHAPLAYWTPAARAFRSHGPAAAYRFDSPQAHAEATLLHVLLMRRMRGGDTLPAAPPQPLPTEELAMNPDPLTLTSNSGPLQEAHAALGRSVQDLRTWWREVQEMGQPRFGEMGARVAAVREIVAQHFRLEEEGGYLQEPVAAAPQLARRAQALLADHAAILADLDRLAERLAGSPCDLKCWTEAWHELAAVLARLEQHEHDEHEFWQTAFAGDLGAGD